MINSDDWPGVLLVSLRQEDILEVLDAFDEASSRVADLGVDECHRWFDALWPEAADTSSHEPLMRDRAAGHLKGDELIRDMELDLAQQLLDRLRELGAARSRPVATLSNLVRESALEGRPLRLPRAGLVDLYIDYLEQGDVAGINSYSAQVLTIATDAETIRIAKLLGDKGDNLLFEEVVQWAEKGLRAARSIEPGSMPVLLDAFNRCIDREKELRKYYREAHQATLGELSPDDFDVAGAEALASQAGRWVDSAGSIARTEDVDLAVLRYTGKVDESVLALDSMIAALDQRKGTVSVAAVDLRQLVDDSRNGLRPRWCESLPHGTVGSVALEWFCVYERQKRSGAEDGHLLAGLLCAAIEAQLREVLCRWAPKEIHPAIESLGLKALADWIRDDGRRNADRQELTWYRVTCRAAGPDGDLLRRWLLEAGRTRNYVHHEAWRVPSNAHDVLFRQIDPRGRSMLQLMSHLRVVAR